MCGIVGQVDFAGPVSKEVVERMSAALEHRGPDSSGAHFDRGVGLASRRLAIIDVEGGDQPIYNEDRSVVVVMNGEIYNFQELRARLEGRGHRFTTRSDTEVLVHLYEDHGPDLVGHLRGMFAFAIWDRSRRQLMCARDRVGKKPLFIARRGDRVWFASELQALLQDPELPREVDFDAIEAYLGLGYVPHPLSALKGIHKLPPATVRVINEAGQSDQCYWSLDYEPKLEGVPEPELEERLRALLDEAVRVRMVSEVPLGAFLSGGIDSSAVVASMAEYSERPVKTFSIGFGDADFNELRFARLTAERFATDHHELIVEPEAVTVLPRLVRHYGEPFADPSALPSFYLAEMASAHVTVALNGDGGDESFAGYSRYAMNRLVAGMDRLPIALRRGLVALRALPGGRASASSAGSRLRRLGLTATMQLPQRYHDWMAPFGAMARDRLLIPELRRGGEYPSSTIVEKWRASRASRFVDRLLEVDCRTYLTDDLLVKMDVATMAHSLEARSPLLDQELMAFAARLPARLKLKGLKGKRIFRHALRGKLPDPVLERSKQGFSVPLARWLRYELNELPAEVLLDPGARTASWFQSGSVERLVKEHSAGTADHGLGLWALLQLEFWSRMVAEAPTPSG